MYGTPPEMLPNGGAPVPPMAPMPPIDPLAQPTPGMPPMESMAAEAPAEAGPKKQPLILPANMASQMARAYADKVVEMASLVATQSGPPDGAVPYSTKKQIQMWRSYDPTVDIAQLRAEGVSESEITRQAYPLRGVLLKLAGRTPLERVRYAQHMKRVASTYVPDMDEAVVIDDESETLDG